ncbi:MAG: hypothetical protein Q8O40_09690 [Chloroflexota bacterium]|nr:hypothetical protein [Chloroflexota bacterium]
MQTKPKDGGAQAREPDLELLAYAAGIFDGEGSGTIQRILTDGPAPRYNLVAAIKMTDPPGIQYLAGHFGGNILRYEQRKAGWSPSYNWAISDPKRSSPFLRPSAHTFG